MPLVKPISIYDLAHQYNTREKCLALLESLRWPDGPRCLKCDCERCYRISTRRVFECGKCKYQFSPTTGTILHRSKLPLEKWIIAAAIISNARKGVSAYQLARDIRVSYETAWYLGHRLRRAMRDSNWLTKFSGICELDEVYLGGRAKGTRGRGAKNKMPVFGVRERGGEVRIAALPNVTGKNIAKIVRQYVETDAQMVIADQFPAYNQLRAEYTLKRINHTRSYVRGAIHTNSIESIWAIVQRQVHGTHHKLSRQYLPLYLSEISYRFNNRNNKDLFMKVLKNALVTDKEVA